MCSESAQAHAWELYSDSSQCLLLGKKKVLAFGTCKQSPLISLDNLTSFNKAQ